MKNERILLMNYIKAYTKAAGEEYPNSFANSVHFALCSGDGEAEELNQGCGILYALAEIRKDDTLMERGIEHPVIFERNGQYGILAKYVDAKGNALLPDTLLLWTTADFIDFSRQLKAKTFKLVSGGVSGIRHAVLIVFY